MYNNTQNVQNEDSRETLGETTKKILNLARDTKDLSSSINNFMFSNVREAECKRNEPDCIEDAMHEISDTLVSVYGELVEICRRLMG